MTVTMMMTTPTSPRFSISLSVDRSTSQVSRIAYALHVCGRRFIPAIALRRPVIRRIILGRGDAGDACTHAYIIPIRVAMQILRAIPPLVETD